MLSKIYNWFTESKFSLHDVVVSNIIALLAYTEEFGLLMVVALLQIITLYFIERSK